jgi:hypothetical protein
MSSISSKATVRILSSLLILAVLYIILIPTASSPRSSVNTTNEASRFGIDTSFLKSAGDKITHVVTGHGQEEEEHTISAGHEEELAGEEGRTEEEEAVLNYHQQQHGHTQPTINSPQPSSSNITEVNVPELRHHTKVNNASAAEHLVLVITKDESHWGHVDGQPRTFSQFIDFFKDTSGLASSAVSFAVLTMSEEAYHNQVSILSTQPFAKTQVLLYTPAIPNVEDPTHRHSPEFQHTRRRQIAIARNMLLHRALSTESSIFFYDADVVASSHNICAQMLSQAAHPNLATHPDIAKPEPVLPVGLITARAQELANPDYDLNAWYHTGLTPQPRTQHMHALTLVTTSDEIFPLMSVGGVLLYIKAELVRQGLDFPWWNVVGGTWESGDGVDGLETEGICYLAANLGSGCYGLGGEWHVEHLH